jgi:hypothetical protein
MLGVVKRLLDALKGETFNEDVFPDFLEAFSTLLRCNTSGDNLRSVALFITYALQDSRAFPARSIRANRNSHRLSSSHLPISQSSTPRSTSPGNDLSEHDLSNHEIGVRVMQMYTEFLCDTASSEPIKKFAKTVANKASLSPIGDPHLLTPQTVVDVSPR